ncbi:MAG: ABC transporter substrate-binding protein [Candidatus Melainabacteria bacterium]|nr:ABC transporter substrate-binding protein [Candidatus Melainabacteria bacterium]
MFYALTENIISSGDFEITNVLKDIQTLNQESKNQKYDVQAISFFAYPEIENEYQLLSCGGSLGNNYGPTVIGKSKVGIEKLIGKTIAIPGEKTTAYLLLKLLLKDFTPVPVPFDQIIEKVSSGEFEYGLIIHEGQLSFKDKGLVEIVDLGKWWYKETKLPVPLGGNVIKRDFPNETKSKINSLIRDSIAYALNHKDEVIPKVTKYARDISGDQKLVSKFVEMYVNEYTLDYGQDGKKAIELLYKKAFNAGLIAKVPQLDFVV